MTDSIQNQNLDIDFSHRLEEKDRTDNDIDRLFNSIGFMTGRARYILETIVNGGMGSLDGQYLADAALCEVRDISAVVGALHKAVNAALEKNDVIG